MRLLIAQLRQRLAHNETYLSQTLATRQKTGGLSHGWKAMLWIEGEDAAIRAENEWIRALLVDFAPKDKASR